MNSSEREALAARIRSASGFEQIEPFHEGIEDTSEAYAIQAINRNFWIDEGREQTGYKVAFTTLESQQLFGTNEPVYGTLFKDMEFASGSTIPAGRLAHPKLEGEIVMELGQDLAGVTLDEATVRAAIGAIYPALEMPDGNVSGKFNAVDMAADNASAAGYVLGERFPLGDDFDLASIGLTMSQNGEVADSGTSDNCMGSPLNVLLWLARALADSGQPLRAGQIVFAGSLIPIIPVKPGDSFEATVDDLGTVSCQFPAE
ncbi:MAG: 2-keto-4-pentenoate hydratase [Candidatus Rariloculaceae bacterium]